MRKRSFRVLLVESDDANYIDIRRVASGLETHIELNRLNDYYDGLEEATHGLYDVYLVGNDLEDHTGLEFIKEAIEAGCKAPFILLTDPGDHTAGAKSMQMGAADYLVKGQIAGPLLERSIRYAVERTQMLEAIRELAVRDELTGLYNYREMGKMLAEEINRTRRYTTELSFLAIGIDGFDAISSTHGPQAAAMLLQSVAQILRGNSRSTDKPVRYGDDMLAVILPETGGDEALIVAERIRQSIAASLFSVAGVNRISEEVTATISLGLASAQADVSDEQALVELAAAALKEAQRLGGNCIVRYSEQLLDRPDNFGRLQRALEVEDQHARR